MTASKLTVDVIGAPIDLGVHEMGLKLGPEAFREAKLVPILEAQGFAVRDLGNVESPVTNTASLSAEQRVVRTATFCGDLANYVSESLKAGHVPVTLGGDHSLAIGSLAGTAQQIERLGCLWIDAHPDANTPQTSPSGNIHGMPTAVALGRGHEELVHIGGEKPSVRPDDMAMVGASDVDAGEQALIDELGVALFTLDDVVEQGLGPVMDRAIERACADTDGVYISFDLDVLHVDVAPGVGIPSDLGFSLREAMYICKRIASCCQVVGVDLVSLNPVRDHDMTTAHRGIELLLAMLGHSFTFRYAEYFQQQHDGLRY